MKLKRCNIYQHIILAGYFDVVLSQIPWIPKNLKNSKNQCELKIVISLSRRLFSYFSFRAKKLYLALKKKQHIKQAILYHPLSTAFNYRSDNFKFILYCRLIELKKELSLHTSTCGLIKDKL